MKESSLPSGPEFTKPRHGSRPHHAYAAMHRSRSGADVFWREQYGGPARARPLDGSSFRSGTCRTRASSLGAKLNVSESCLDRHLTTSRRHQGGAGVGRRAGDTRTLDVLRASIAKSLGAGRRAIEPGVAPGESLGNRLGLVPETARRGCSPAPASARPTSVILRRIARGAPRCIKRCRREGTADAGRRVGRGSVVPPPPPHLKTMADDASPHTRRSAKVCLRPSAPRSPSR